MDVVELAKELVAIESVTLREGRVVAHVSERLAAEGWKVQLQEIEGGDSSVPGKRANVLAVDDDTQPPRLVFTTHLDTVPPFIPPTEDDHTLFGRGTCDAKGIFAAQWIAMQILRQRGHQRLALLGVVGEETDSIGAKKVGAILPRADWIVDGEPTEMKMTSAAKGILALRLLARGVACHSAYPELGKSAVHTLLRGLAKVVETDLPADPDLGITTANVGVMSGGVAPNVLAPEARAELVIRLAAPLKTVLEEVERRLGPEIEYEIPTSNEPMRIYVPEGFAAAPVSFGSDVPYLRDLGTTLLVGPGSIHDAHTKGEHIGKDELKSAVDFYVALGERLLATTPPAREASR